MNGLSEFFYAVLGHWGWLALATIASFLYAKVNFVENDKVRMALILVAVASLFIALYLASADQYKALHEHLKVS